MEHCVLKKFTDKIFDNDMYWRNLRKFSFGENFHVYGIMFSISNMLAC